MTEDQIRELIAQWKARIERCRRIRDERAASGEDALARSWHEEADTIEDCSRQLERLLLAERPQPQEAPKPHQWTTDGKDLNRCVICGDGPWGIHRFQEPTIASASGVCTCKPFTAAGVVVTDPHCAVHGTPRFTFNGKPLGSPTP